ncbi:MAG: DUF3892 domain-containing protein [Mycoplasmatales bacterium]|nr:DUF3892 domain-containing protein [Mycoplasmatales bacterium]
MSIKIVGIRSNGPSPENITHFQTDDGKIFTRLAMYEKVNAGGDFLLGIEPFLKINSEISSVGTKYIKSEDDLTDNDNIMKLKRF